MAQKHTHHHHDHHEGGHHGEAGLADVLDLDAEVLGSYLDEVIEWVAGYAPAAPRTIADVGAGTGTGLLALARRFQQADLVAIDQSPLLLERLGAKALQQGLTERLRIVETDLDAASPPIGTADLAWAASSLHHVKDPDRLLGDLHEALTPGGLLVVIEMDALPRFLPDDLGIGRPGLETRCHDAAAQERWNAHPNWGPYLERAGFEVVQERSFPIAVSPAPPSAGRYAHTMLSAMRFGVGDRLAADDLHALDRLLADDSAESLLRRTDLTVRGSRTAWAARRH
ncbi:class I SAM-dependent methyltransferase [Streptomyces albipurpureus]|uniref:Methyltransferase domain-containing protein n=1 Tax=Streptomyces albipurpureus TaxID=2897419 RepID=A0ABT0UHT4_9ACTN|nr:class I SAM-dependent methyltransferase [Streptomyces sp. CWNU-1]MCM2386876.1 methyltransferase domain-containing protein [Streptomyces sp. CWNU-1]